MKNELAMFKIIMLMMTKNHGGHASGQMLFYQASTMDTRVVYDGVRVYPLSRLEFWLAPPT